MLFNKGAFNTILIYFDCFVECQLRANAEDPSCVWQLRYPIPSQVEYNKMNSTVQGWSWLQRTEVLQLTLLEVNQ